MRRPKYYVITMSICVLFKIFYTLSDYPGEAALRSYESDFRYPLDVDLKPLVAEILGGYVPTADVQPINFYGQNFQINTNVCLILPQIDLIIAVSSAIDNFEHRNAIRKTYGKEHRVRGKLVRTLFFVAVRESSKFDDKIKLSHLERESEVYKDIIQANVSAHFYFNTVKTMTTFKWLFEYCPNFLFCLFTNDYMFISPANLLRYLSTWKVKVNKRDEDRRLLAGNVFPKFEPQRVPENRWYISPEAFHWDSGPPFVDGSAFVMSSEAVDEIFAASLFVRYLVYDDVYIGIVAHKIGLRPTHCTQFHFKYMNYTRSGFRDVIAYQVFNKPKTLIDIWKKQNKLS